MEQEHKQQLLDLLTLAYDSIDIPKLKSEGNRDRRIRIFRGIHTGEIYESIRTNPRNSSLPPSGLLQVKQALLLKRFDQKADISNAAIKKNLIELLKEVLAEYLIDDQIKISRSTTSSVPLGKIVEELSRLCILFGPLEATSIFEETVDKNRLPCKKVFLLGGLKLEQNMSVSQGIRLEKIPDNSDDLPDYLFTVTSSFEQISQKATSPDEFANFPPTRYFLNRPILVIDSYLSPIFGHVNPSQKLEPEYMHDQGEMGFNLRGGEFGKIDVEIFSKDFCNIFSLFKNNAVTRLREWSYLDNNALRENTPMSSFAIISESIRDVPASLTSKNDVRKVVKLYKQWVNLDEQEKSTMRISLDYWVKSKEDRPTDKQLLSLSTALEKIYVPDSKTNTTENLSCRGAWYLTKDPKCRENIRLFLKKMYKIRSDAVHEGKVKLCVNVNGKDMYIKEIVRRAQDLYCQSALKVIQSSGRPDWKKEVPPRKEWGK